MSNISKEKSPFYPGQPVPVDFFFGRQKEVQQVIRAVSQVESGKPQAVFLTGEYGIGKSSLAGLMKSRAERNNHILGLHVLLGGAETLEDVATKTVEAAIRTEAYEHTVTEKVRNFLSTYIGKQDLFGVNINFDKLKTDGPNISAGFLPFLCQLFERVKEDGIKGVMLILDEIDEIAGNAKFAHFIKTLVDENAIKTNPLPLVLMLCGIEKLRREMVQQHPPIERIFDIVEIQPMNNNEMEVFFNNTFNSVGMQVAGEAMSLLCHYSAGFPKIMQIISENVFWMDQDNVIDKEDVFEGVINAAEDIRKKFANHKIYAALNSKDYHSVLVKLSKEEFDLSFVETNIEKGLSAIEKCIFNNFLQHMKELDVLKPGNKRGEYIFSSRLVKTYVLLNSFGKNNHGT